MNNRLVASGFEKRIVMSYNTYMLHKIVNIHYFNINNRTISLHINNRNKLETFISGAYKDPLFFFLHYERKIFIWRFKILAFYGILSMYLLAINAFVCVISSTHTNLLYPSVVHVIRFIVFYLFFFLKCLFGHRIIIFCEN